MAYKYKLEDVEKVLQDNGLFMSDADQRLARENPDAGMSIANSKLGHKGAKTPEEQAMYNAAAEQVRAREGGYTGGADGSKFKLDYTYAPKPSVEESPYTKLMQSKTDDILDRDPFSYNAASDPSYQAYSEKYRNLGRNSMQNALGNAAAMTGGQLSSYALTAAQQANDAYNAQLSDAIPTLEQAAYQKYVSELNQNRNDLSMLQGLDNTWYGREQERYQNDVNKYQLDYSADRDKLADQRYDTEWQASEEQRAYTNAIQQSETYGYVVSDEAAAILGVPKGTSTQSKEYQDAQIALDQRQMAINESQNELSHQQFAYNQQQDAQTRSTQQSQQAIDNAMALWQMTGTLDPSGAAVLGIPAGTPFAGYEKSQQSQGKTTKSGGYNLVWDEVRRYYEDGLNGDSIGRILDKAISDGKITEYEAGQILDNLGL